MHSFVPYFQQIADLDGGWPCTMSSVHAATNSVAQTRWRPSLPACVSMSIEYIPVQASLTPMNPACTNQCCVQILCYIAQLQVGTQSLLGWSDDQSENRQSKPS
jgi:hypothetical protein